MTSAPVQSEKWTVKREYREEVDTYGYVIRDPQGGQRGVCQGNYGGWLLAAMLAVRWAQDEARQAVLVRP